LVARTGGFGKWDCGGRDSTGVPKKHGFDLFLRYYDHVHAHTYCPSYLIQNSEKYILPGNAGGRTGGTYSQYLIHDAAMNFIKDNATQSFFYYMPFTPPHGLLTFLSPTGRWRLIKIILGPKRHANVPRW